MYPSTTPWYATKKFINGAIIGAVVLVALFILIGIFSTTNNHYVALTQNVSTSKSNISKEEQRRVDLFNNMVDSVQSARTFEADTQTKIAQARSQGNSGHVDQAQITLQSVVEAYPEIKSIDLYKQTNLEFSVTENRLAQYREQYNNDVRSFNSYVGQFGAGIVLSLEGKDKTQKPYLDYKVDNSQARNLFDK